MTFYNVNRFFFTTALLGALFLVAGDASAATQKDFFVDSGFDLLQRPKISASLYYEGNRAHYYVEQDFTNKLSPQGRDQVREYLAELSDSFDNDIYKNLTYTFGLPWTPGIDNDVKITILLTQMEPSFGGYFRADDEYPLARVPDSNEREMIYLSTDLIARSHAKEFLAHEFQHLINFNQKTRTKGIIEDLWVNEMLSEVAPTIANISPDTLEGTNLKDRAVIYIGSSSESFIDWGDETENYAAVNIFGHYLYEQFGSELFTSIILSDKTGIPAVEHALAQVGSSKTFNEVFLDWTIASLLNDCSIEPADVYCYGDSLLDFDALHINFGTIVGVGDVVTSTETLKDFSASWFRYNRELEPVSPGDSIFFYEFLTGTVLEGFDIPYIVYEKNKDPQIFFTTVNGGRAKIVVEDFGFKVDKVVVIPSHRPAELEAGDLRFTHQASLYKVIPDDTIPTRLTVDTLIPQEELADGALVKYSSDEKIYIIKGDPNGGGGWYKRWIQSPEIINMYGHLRWENVINVAPQFLNQYLDSNVVRFAGDPRVYRVLDDGRKVWISTEEEFLQRGYTFDMVYEINELEWKWYK